MVVAKEWGNRVGGCKREEIKVEELKKSEKKREYQERLKMVYDRVKGRAAGKVGEEWKPMKESLVGNVSNVCGKRAIGGCIRRGSEWRNEGVKVKVEEKKNAFEEWLQCGRREKYERYKALNREVKQMVREAKRAANNRWGQDFTRAFEENKKKFWKELKRTRRGKSRIEEVVKDRNGQLVKGEDARKRWAEYFKGLLNIEEYRKAEIVAVAGVQCQ